MAHYHFIGIGGTGLAPIARVLLEKGHQVSGSDRILSPLAKDLQALGVQVYLGHDPKHVEDADMVIRSSAVKEDNPEVRAAIQLQIPVLKRSEFLKRLVGNQECIAIAGTHGKTTTTAMIAWELASLRLDPSYVIGSVSKDLQSNAHYGKGKYFVIEADEYDYMFYGLAPSIEVITHVEYDHPDCFPTPAVYHKAFEGFVSRLLPNGNLLLCADDPAALSLRSMVKTARRISTYGTTSDALFRANNIAPNAKGGFDYSLEMTEKGHSSLLTAVSLSVPGRHNILNSLAALVTIQILGLSVKEAALALRQFTGVSRRFDILGEVNRITIIDDYAHHPTEIRATLSAAKSRFPGRFIWAVWQPHTYTRVLALTDDFIHAFDDADQVLVTEVYAAREQNASTSAKQMVDLMPQSTTRFVPDFASASSILLRELKPGDVLLVLSAGDADQISTAVYNALKERK